MPLHTHPHLAPFLLLLFFIFAPSILAMALPQQQQQQQGATLPTLTNATTTTNTNATAANANLPIICNKRGASRAESPTFSDCAGVLRKMPLDPSIGTFYNTGRGDFQLPWFDTYKSCTVLVEMRGRYDRVQSSWLAVQVAAMELNEACQDVRRAPGLSSAVTYMGNMDEIKITLKGPQQSLSGYDGSGDATDATDTA